MRIKLIFFLFLGLLVLSGAWIAFRNISANKEQLSRFEKIPQISLLSLDGTEVLLPDLILSMPNVLIYFNSTCPICQSEAELLVREYSQDSSVNFIWISSEPLGALDEFRDRFGLDILPNHILASDTLLLGISSSGAFAYRYWVDHYMNGKLVNSWCGGVDGNCLPEVIVQ